MGDSEGGIYAFKTRSRAESEARNDKWENPIVVGSVRLWGDSIEAANGWRDEYAAINSLDFVYFSEKAREEYWPKSCAVETPISGGLFKRKKFISAPIQKLNTQTFLSTLQEKYVGRPSEEYDEHLSELRSTARKA